MDTLNLEKLGELAPRVRSKLEADEDLILTRHGKPFPLFVHTDADRLEESLQAIRAARLAQTLAEMRRNAGERGIDPISDAEIEAEIAAVRRERALDASGRH